MTVLERKNNKTYAICCLTNLFSSIGVVFPLLMVPLRDLYGITYTQFGILISLNFCVQIISDVLFSKQVDKYGFKTFAVLTPLVSSLSMILYALTPILFKENIFLGLVLATILFAAAGGLNELLLSPIVDSITFAKEKKDAKMSLMHSFFAWGQIIIIPITTLVLKYFGSASWARFILVLSILPLFCCLLFLSLDWSVCSTKRTNNSIRSLFKSKVFLVAVFAIIVGGATEVTMAQWASAFLERAIALPKEIGDILGLCAFALLLATGRTLHGLVGKKCNTNNLLIIGSFFFFCCYLVTALTSSAVFALISCALTGFCASLLWPGTISVVAKALPTAGASLFALMSASGDIGASVSSFIVGNITDIITSSSLNFLGYSGEVLGLRVGILFASLFPLLSILLQINLKKMHKE